MHVCWAGVPPGCGKSDGLPSHLRGVRVPLSELLSYRPDLRLLRNVGPYDPAPGPVCDRFVRMRRWKASVAASKISASEMFANQSTSCVYAFDPCITSGNKKKKYREIFLMSSFTCKLTTELFQVKSPVLLWNKII